LNTVSAYKSLIGAKSIVKIDRDKLASSSALTDGFGAAVRSSSHPAPNNRGIDSRRRLSSGQRNKNRSKSARNASSSGNAFDAEKSDNSGNRCVSAPRR